MSFKLSSMDLIFNASFNNVQQTLNDSGIVEAGNYPTTDNMTCSSNISAAQDCHHGRDNTDNIDDDGKAGFSFTKLDANGVPLAASAMAWTCVEDNITGLIWEVKTLDNSVHNKENLYNWGGITHQGTGFGTYFDGWDILVNNSNVNTYCGLSTWRVPTSRELISLIDYNKFNFTIDLNYFPNTQNSNYWSSTPSNQYIDQARNVSFNDGESVHTGFRSGDAYVRLVSSGQ